MDNARRNFIKLGTGAAVGSLVASPVVAKTEIQLPASTDGQAALRLVTFSPHPGMAPRVGVVTGKGMVVDVGAAAQAHNITLSFDPSSMVSLIAAGPQALAQVQHCAADESTLSVNDVQLCAPIPVPQRNVYAVGWNYLEHFHESITARAAKAKLPTHPVFFTKDTHTVNGPFDPIPYNPAISRMIDWEGELAIIVGKRGVNISESDAMNYVFGYTVINDTTARDMQVDHGGQWFKGKSLDGHGPMGPWIVPASRH